MEILDFYADWCGPCQIMKPTIEEFGKLHPEIKITLINIDDEEELAEEYQVSNIPCLVFMKDNKEVAREVGVVPLKKIEKLIGK